MMPSISDTFGLLQDVFQCYKKKRVGGRSGGRLVTQAVSRFMWSSI